jgi:hypothetical protein
MPCTNFSFFVCPFLPFFFPWDRKVWRFGALRRSSELISVLEIPFDSLSWRDDCKGMPRDRLPENGSDAVM